MFNNDLTKKYGRMRQLTSSDNLDNITDNGIYWYPTESVPQNAPYQNAAVVEVIGSTSATGEKFQRVTRYGVPGKSSWRPLGGGSNGWLAWAESLTNADFIYANSVSELLSKMESRQTARTYTLHAGNALGTALTGSNASCTGVISKLSETMYDLMFMQGSYLCTVRLQNGTISSRRRVATTEI